MNKLKNVNQLRLFSESDKPSIGKTFRQDFPF